MLADFLAACNIEVPETFLTVEQISPGQGLASLHLTAGMEEAITKLPPEDQQWVRFAFDDYARQMQRTIVERIAIFRWILDESGVPEGGRGGGLKLKTI